MSEIAKTGKPNHQVLFVASADDFEPMAKAWLKDFQNLQFVPSPPLETLIEGAPAGMNPKLILLDGRGDSQRTFEWTQTLKMALNVPLVVFYDAGSKLNFAVLKKNGADSILHLYYDAEFIVDKLLDLVTWDDDASPPLGMLNALAIEDLTCEMELNFDVYVHLPGNQKSILVRRKGGTLDQKLIDKVGASHQNVYFKKSQLKHFLEYSRTVLSLRNSSEAHGVTDKIIRTRQRIQEIISQFFDQEAGDFKSGRVILENCEKIIEDLEIKKWKNHTMAFRAMVLFSSRTRSFYNDVMTLSILAAGIGFLMDKKPEEIHELALAGLLHNVGLAFMTNPVLEPTSSALKPQDKKEYDTYPERSVNQIKGKKVPLPQNVSDLILQHMEKSGGGGFPKSTTSDFHHANSKIIQLAYQLMQLTQLEDNKAQYTLKAAIDFLQEEVMAGSSKQDGTLVMNLNKKLASLMKAKAS